MILKNQKNKKAASLAEVMIVLGIISTAMVASVSVMINSLINIRVNEIEDSANYALIQALEIAKSPTGLVFSSDISSRPINSSVFLSLESDKKLTISSGNQALTTCSENSVYNIKKLLASSISVTSNICVQVEMIPRNGIGGEKIYEIIARSAFVLPSGKDRANVIRGYRYTVL